MSGWVSRMKQMELGLERVPEPDRNFAKGGRSFYFFDFDDNVAFLTTAAYVFHKETGKELRLSSREFAEHSGQFGKSGIYKDYEVRYDEATGTFRNFRDQPFGLLHKMLRKKQMFVEDLAHVLGYPDVHWKGPSWSCFYHAVFNQRPISLITARGHHPETMKRGISLWVKEKHLPKEPNYMSLYPVSHPPTRSKLGFELGTPIAQLKQAAIRASVKTAIEQYGPSPFHRFGMSDDDPHNVKLIIEEMARLKSEYQEMSFFVIETHKGDFIKREVFADYTVDQVLLPRPEQLSFFDK